MVGAVLTQNTAWTNVERGLERLKGKLASGLDIQAEVAPEPATQPSRRPGPESKRMPGDPSWPVPYPLPRRGSGARPGSALRPDPSEVLTPQAILALPEGELADCLRPVGYFNVKARRLRAFCDAYIAAGEREALSRLATAELRHRLLAIPGVGPETADDMLLYAFDRPVFVVDAYTRRILSRLGLLGGDEGYETIRQGLEAALGPDIALFNEYHALIVRHGKEVCRPKPRCGACCLVSRCPTALPAPEAAGLPIAG